MSGSGWTSTSMPYLTARAAGTTDAWSEEAATAGRRGGQRILHAAEVAAPPDVTRMLGLADPGIVVARRRIIELDGEPTELTDTFYPMDIAAGTPLAGTAKIRGGAVTLLATLGHIGVRVVENVTARMPSAEEREQLHLGPGEPVLQLARVTYDSADRAIQADLMVMPAGRQPGRVSPSADQHRRRTRRAGELVLPSGHRARHRPCRAAPHPGRHPDLAGEARLPAPPQRGPGVRPANRRSPSRSPSW